jgi:hypothetical protein
MHVYLRFVFPIFLFPTNMCFGFEATTLRSPSPCRASLFLPVCPLRFSISLFSALAKSLTPPKPLLLADLAFQICSLEGCVTTASRMTTSSPDMAASAFMNPDRAREEMREGSRPRDERCDSNWDMSLRVFVRGTMARFFNDFLFSRDSFLRRVCLVRIFSAFSRISSSSSSTYHKHK